MKRLLSKRNEILRFWLPPVLWAIIIFSFSSLQVGSTSQVYWKDFIVKKTAHIIEYGILALLLYRAMINTGADRKNAKWVAILIAFLYGLSDEVHQSFTPGRQPRIRDVIIDTLGASLFLYGLVNNISKMPKIVKDIVKDLNVS